MMTASVDRMKVLKEQFARCLHRIRRKPLELMKFKESVETPKLFLDEKFRIPANDVEQFGTWAPRVQSLSSQDFQDGTAPRQADDLPFFCLRTEHPVLKPTIERPTSPSSLPTHSSTATPLSSRRGFCGSSHYDSCHFAPSHLKGWAALSDPESSPASGLPRTIRTTFGSAPSLKSTLFMSIQETEGNTADSK